MYSNLRIGYPAVSTVVDTSVNYKNPCFQNPPKVYCRRPTDIGEQRVGHSQVCIGPAYSELLRWPRSLNELIQFLAVSSEAHLGAVLPVWQTFRAWSNKSKMIPQRQHII